MSYCDYTPRLCPLSLEERARDSGCAVCCFRVCPFAHGCTAPWAGNCPPERGAEETPAARLEAWLRAEGAV